MKLGKVRAGERFVFDHVGGVWVKIAPDVARCIYGSNAGRTEKIEQDWSVNVIFNQNPQENPVAATPQPMTVTQTPTEQPVSPSSEVKLHEPVSDETLANEPAMGIVDKDRAPLPEPQETMIYAAPKPEPPKSDTLVMEKATGGIVSLVLVDEEENVIAEIKNPTASQVAAYSQADGLKFNNNKGRHVHENLVDHVNQILYIVVGEELK